MSGPEVDRAGFGISSEMNLWKVDIGYGTLFDKIGDPELAKPLDLSILA